MIKVEFHPEAELELAAAQGWYRERSELRPGLLLRKLLAVFAALPNRRTVGPRRAPESAASSFPDFRIRFDAANFFFPAAKRGGDTLAANSSPRSGRRRRCPALDDFPFPFPAA